MSSQAIPRGSGLLVAIVWLMFTGAASAQNLEVTNTDDAGPGSLRAAISDANDAGAASTITFDIPGDGPHVITPDSLLPTITVPIVIDGLSQPGADCSAWPPNLEVEISGVEAGSWGLRLGDGSDGSIIRGLVIRDHSDDNTSTGLLIGPDENHIACNFIGTDVTGTEAAGNTRGVTLSGSQSNIIGAVGEWGGEYQRNLVSGNVNIGVYSSGNAANDNRISGNLIGTDVTGHSVLGSTIGISMGAPGGTPTEGVVIGYDGNGDPERMRNIISGHSDAGISLGNNTRGFHIAGNYIGLNQDGDAALPNGHGISSTGGSPTGPRLHHLIGWDGTPGQRQAQRNVISGNNDHGVSISFFGDRGDEHAVAGNWIGVDALGENPLGNGLYGISLAGGEDATRVMVHGNRIASNSSGGIQLFANSPSQHPAFWNDVTSDEIPELDSDANCLEDNGAGVARAGSSSPVSVSFAGNWWGADDGPSGSGEGSGDSIPGAVSYQPFLDTPPDHCSAPSPELLFESRAPGTSGGGLVISNSLFPGHTFRLLEPAEITGLGGDNLSSYSSESIFTALYKIATPDSTPDVANDSDLLEAAVIEVDSSSPVEGIGEVSLTLEPGWYSILMGSGRHGATAGDGAVTLGSTGTSTTPQSLGAYSMNADTNQRILQSATTRLLIQGFPLEPAAPDPNDFLFETARPSAWWTQGATSVHDLFRATRFELTQTTQLQEAGAWLRAGSGQIFAAVVPLSGPDALPPPGDQLEDDAVAATLIDVGSPPDSYTGEFSDLVLDPGHYALVFGSGLFGADGSAWIMGVNDQIIEPESLVWTGNFWGETDSSFRMFLEGFVPDLLANPDLLAFDDTLVGEAAGETITLTNQREDGDLKLQTIEIHDDTATQFAVDPDDCIANPIIPGETCSLAVEFMPGETGSHSATLEISGDGNPATLEIPLQGEGVAPVMEPDPGMLDFEVIIGEQDVQPLVLDNTGDADLEWSITPSQTGSDACDDPENIPWLSASPDDGSTPPGETGVMDVMADSTELSAGTYSAQICISSNDPNQTLVVVPVDLTVTAPELSFDPAALDFGEVELGQSSVTLSATLSNTGDATASGLEYAMIESNGAGSFTLQPVDCTSDLPAGESCQIELSFQPVETGPAEGQAEATGDQVTAYAELDLAGTGTEPALQLSSAELAFGEVPLDETGDALTLTLTSAGTAPVEIDGLSEPGEPFEPAGGSCVTPPFSMDPGESCTLEYTFSPETIGEVTSTVTLTGNAPSSPDQVGLSGTGVAAHIDTDPEAFSLEVLTGQSDSRSLAVSNTGNIELDWLLTTETDCDDGSSVEWLSAEPTDATTPPEQTTPVEVTIDAGELEAGTYSAALCLATNAHETPLHPVPVNLTVTTPALVFDPPELDFGDVEIDTSSDPQTALLLNEGDGDAGGLDFHLPDGFEAETGDCGDTLAAGESCPISIHFTPEQAGTVEELLGVDTDQGPTGELAISGNGVEGGALGADPEKLDFSGVAVDDHRTLELAVRNTAAIDGTDIEIASVNLQGGEPVFESAGDDCPPGTTLAPQEECFIEIRFTPDEPGPHYGELAVTTVDEQQVTIELFGTGLGDTIFLDRFEN